jgi:basic membrane lipoprotein Med (substrate-binding protein (PBP1-ABC) superfamily)
MTRLRRLGALSSVWHLFLLTVAALLFAAGCAQKEENSSSGAAATGGETKTAATTGSPAAPAGPFKVALVTPSKISDKGWGQSAYEGTQRIKQELGAVLTQPVEEPPQAQFESILRDLAQQGSTIVFCHGEEYDDAAKKVARDFPKTTFVVMGGKSTGPNLIPIQFESGQATYLAGMLAGGMTKTGKVGLVGGIEIPIIKEAFVAFDRGAHATRPDVKVTTTFTGDGKDVAKAKQQAQALLDSGNDVLMHNADAAGAGVFHAVMDKQGAMVIGANDDQSDQATPKNLGSFILDVRSAMLAVAKAVKEGKTDGKPFEAGLKDGAVGFKFNPGFKGTIPQAVKDKMDKAKEDMIAGTLDPLK